MTQEIQKSSVEFLDDKFFIRRQVWVQLGANLPTDLSASEAYKIFGDYSITTESLWEPVLNTQGEPTMENEGTDFTRMAYKMTDMRGIYIKSPTMQKDTPPVRVGVVKGRYMPLQPEAIVKMWEETIKLPVNAIGATGQYSETFFLSSRLEPMEIGGDTVEMFLVGLFPTNGLGSAEMRVTPVKLACTNMLIASREKAVMVGRIPHSGRVLEGVQSWMRHIVGQSEERKRIIQGDFETLAGTKATKKMIEQFEDAVYTLPKGFNEIGPEDVVERRKKDYELLLAFQNRKRQSFRELFEDGKGLGMESEALKGTMFGVLNAGVELEQYRRTSQGEQGRAMAVLTGARGKEIEKVYRTALTIAEGSSTPRRKGAK